MMYDGMMDEAEMEAIISEKKKHKKYCNAAITLLNHI